MTDKELLQLAAKAAGIVGEWVQDKNFIQERWYFNVPYDHHNMLTGFEWNPLTDDGDAMRLAVKLNLSISTGPCIVKCNSISGALRGNFIEEDSIYQDRYAATRRAIVRAAAEIGKGMK
jgi:hypothetical protein